MKLKEFIETYGDCLSKRIEEEMKPLYNPLNPEGVEWVEKKIPILLRKPYPVQAEIIKGLSKALYKEGRQRLVISGEMGTGKTMIALGTIAMAEKPMRVLVLSPTHLVEKWKREARETIPDVRVVDLAVRNVISVLDAMRTQKEKPVAHEVYVISKERCKLSYGWRAAFIKTKRSKLPHCPDCGEVAIKGGRYLNNEMLCKKKEYCEYCGGALWQADQKLRRYSPAEYIKKYLKNYFDLIIVDEVHDYKAGDSLQGNAMSQVLSASKKVICLTGTLNGGYADDLFYLLYRLEPSKMVKEGFKYKELKRWIETYGVIEYERKLGDEEDSYYGRNKKRKIIVKRRPGISPVVVGNFLLDKTVFVRLSDVIEGLPPYEENVITIPMREQWKEYEKLGDELRYAVREYGMRVVSSMLQSLLSYPDSCVLYPEEIGIRDSNGELVGVVNAPVIKADILPKEEELLKICKKEKKEGRKVLCYLTFTGSRDIRPRLLGVLNKHKFKVGILDASVEPKKREAWIQKNSRDIDVLLVNAELVKTGLDLYEFPTVCFFQTGYSIFTLRQAARRSWRIGQNKPVKVFFLCYQGTMQETALTLIARKLEAAVLVEGDLPEGLAEYLTSGESIAEELVRALVDGSEYGGAEAAWASFRKREIESQLGIGGKETIFTEEKVAAKSKSTIRDDNNIIIKVTILGKKKKHSKLEVKYGDLESILQEGEIAQFAMF